MIADSEMIADDFSDDISMILNDIRRLNSWTAKKAQLRSDLVSLLRRHRYIEFSGSPYRYSANRVGDSYLCDVPLYKQGFLKKFRGKRIRVVCVASGRFTREYMAGAIGPTPRELVVEKLVHEYRFPSYVRDGDIALRTRRFVLFKPEGKLRIISSKEHRGYLDADKRTYVLVDGKDSEPKGMLTENTDGSVTCRLLGWVNYHEASSLREGALYLARCIRKGRW